MPNCTIVEQTANDLFEPEIQPNSPKNDTFRPFIRLKILTKFFGIVQLKGCTIKYSLKKVKIVVPWVTSL